MFSQVLRAARGWPTKSLNISPDDNGEPSSPGFDSVVALDRLGRTNLARSVYDLLTILPSGWSVRVGLLGEWGSGKTTVATWLVNRAREEGHIVAYLKPWTAASIDDLWLTFAKALHKACSSQGVNLGIASKLTAAESYQRLRTPATALAGLDPKAKAVASTIDNVTSSFDLLRFTSKDLKAIADKIPNRRLIIVIDDLDRTDPAVLPRTLLALRDLLDLPRFSFLLPFDETVVSSALSAYNKAWGDGAAFLDKILDFRVRLEPPSNEAKWTLFEADLKAHCPFVPLDQLQRLADYLPDNPRRIRAIARNLIIFGPQAVRHKPEEIDWLGLTFAVMVRLTSEGLYQAMVRGLIGDDEVVNWHMADFSIGRGQSRDVDKEIGEVVAQHIDLEAARPALLRLCRAWRKSTSVGNLGKLKYTLDLLTASNQVTWKEFDIVYARWQQTPTDLRDALEDVAGGLPLLASALNAVVEAAFSQYSDLIKLSLSTFKPEDCAAELSRASSTFAFIGALSKLAAQVEEADDRTVRIFCLMAGQAVSFQDLVWGPLNKEMREAELDFLRTMLTDHPSLRTTFRRALQDTISGQHTMGRAARPLQALLEATPAGSEEDLEAIFKRHGSFEVLRRENNGPISRLVFDPASSAWEPHGRSRMDTVLAEAGCDDAVQRNLFTVLEDLAGMARTGAGEFDEEFRRMIEHPDALRRIWSAALVREVQPRMWVLSKTYRLNLINSGASPHHLPEPSWVRGRLPDLGLPDAG